MKKFITIAILALVAVCSFSVESRAQYAYPQSTDNQYVLTGGAEKIEKGLSNVIVGSLTASAGLGLSAISYTINDESIGVGVGAIITAIGGVVGILGTCQILSGLNKSTHISGNGVNITFGTSRNMKQTPSYSVAEAHNIKTTTKEIASNTTANNVPMTKLERYEAIVAQNLLEMEGLPKRSQKYKIMDEQNRQILAEIKKLKDNN